MIIFINDITFFPHRLYSFLDASGVMTYGNTYYRDQATRSRDE